MRIKLRTAVIRRMYTGVPFTNAETIIIVNLLRTYRKIRDLDPMNTSWAKSREPNLEM
jgi:hypothetical protein